MRDIWLGMTLCFFACSSGEIVDDPDMLRGTVNPTPGIDLGSSTSNPRVNSPDVSSQPRPMPTDGGGVQQMGDRYVPPVQRDAGMLTAADRLGQCVERMTTFLQNTSVAVGCGEYDEAEQMNVSSGYNQERKTAACIQLSCQGTQIEGHNGIPAQRTCAQLADLVTVLARALQQAVDGGCVEPRFQLRVLSLDEFMGGEACDQLTCGIDEQGDPITIDNRN
jgi:hypothetical protein